MRLNTVVFSASIQNDDEIRSWIESVQGAAEGAHVALDNLVGLLAQSPHIAITLHADDDASDESKAATA